MVHLETHATRGSPPLALPGWQEAEAGEPRDLGYSQTQASKQEKKKKEQKKKKKKKKERKKEKREKARERKRTRKQEKEQEQESKRKNKKARKQEKREKARERKSKNKREKKQEQEREKEWQNPVPFKENYPPPRTYYSLIGCSPSAQLSSRERQNTWRENCPCTCADYVYHLEHSCQRHLIMANVRAAPNISPFSFNKSNRPPILMRVEIEVKSPVCR